MGGPLGDRRVWPQNDVSAGGLSATSERSGGDGHTEEEVR